jgi:predicted XRE-type DNA-binding protein
MATLNRKQLTELARRLIENRGMTQKDVAEKLNIPQSRISEAMHGRAPHVTRRIIKALSGVTVKDDRYEIDDSDILGFFTE